MDETKCTAPKRSPPQKLVTKYVFYYPCLFDISEPIVYFDARVRTQSITWVSRRIRVTVLFGEVTVLFQETWKTSGWPFTVLSNTTAMEREVFSSQ